MQARADRSAWRRRLLGAAGAGLALAVTAGCGSAGPAPAVGPADGVQTPSGSGTGEAGSDSRPGATTDPDADAAALIAAALAARDAADRPGFVSGLQQAALACGDPVAAGRLGEVTLIATRWAAALEDNRPKVQARTEEQLAAVPWDELAAACSPS